MMKKRMLSTLLALCIVLALLPMTALAAETSGSCGENVTWSYSDGTLTIEGTGEMDDYYMGHGLRPWEDYSGEIHTVVIGDGVTRMGTVAFYNFTNLTSVTIGSNVINIGYGAFEGCENLTGMIIPDSVIFIDEFAFNGCTSLTSITIPDSVTEIGGNAFYYCPNLTSVTLPASVTYIAGGAFSLCDRLTDVYYGGSESQWGAITGDSDEGEVAFADGGQKSTGLDGVTVHYNSTGSDVPAEPEQPAAPAEPEQPAAPDGISVTVGGPAVTWTDVAPFIDANSRTMVPLRAVADAMGLEVDWSASARIASFSDGSKTISFPIDSTSAQTSDGDAVQMDTAAVIVNARTYAPIRYLAEYFGYEVGWDAATQTVSLTK